MNIGLVAHDSKKKLMQNFCIAYRGILVKNDLFATGTTGRLIEEVTNLNVHKYLNILQDILGDLSSLEHRLSTMRLIWLSFCAIHSDQSPMSRMSTVLSDSVMSTIFHLQQIWQQQSF